MPSSASSPSPAEADYMLVDESDGEESTEDVYPIPDQIPDSEVEGFVQRLKLTLGIGYTVTLDMAARTITFDQPSRKLMPGPALDKNGAPHFITYDVPLPEERAKKLKDTWQEIELNLYRDSISCDLNLAECSMQVSTTTSLKDPCMVGKARNVLELLSTTPVPLYMAFEIFKDVRQQETINIGFQNGGICSNFGINKALSKVACCHIFLDENTFTAVTAVGSSVEKLSLLKAVVEDCITNDVCLSTSIRRFEMKVMHESMDEPHAKHTHSLKCGLLSNEDGMLEVCSLYASLHENRGGTLFLFFLYFPLLLAAQQFLSSIVSKLQKSLPMLGSSLRNYGISYTLDENSLVLSTTRGTKDPDIIDKAWQLFELLSITHVPASMAIELLNGMHTCLIKIGNQEGGLSSLCGIKEEVDVLKLTYLPLSDLFYLLQEEYRQRWECIRHSLEILAETVECNVFLNDNTVAAVGKDSVEMVKQLVRNCILYNVCPGTAASNYNLLSQGISIEDPHKPHVEMECSGSAMRIMPELSSFCTFFYGEQATWLGKDFKSVKANLKKHDLSCQLFSEADYCYMIVSKTINTGDPDISSKIWDFLKLLSTDVKPFKAIEALNGDLRYDFIPTGYRYGKFCSKAGITEEDFAKVVWPRIELGLKEISSQLKLEYFISPDFTAVMGVREVEVLRRFVLQCFCLRMPTAISMQAKIDGKTVCPIDPEPGLTVVYGPGELRAFRGFVYRCFRLRPFPVMKFWPGGKKGKN
ncbi:hypothetical protein ACLB2K_046672 [Fragaria x ananassa]